MVIYYNNDDLRVQTYSQSILQCYSRFTFFSFNFQAIVDANAFIKVYSRESGDKLKLYSRLTGEETTAKATTLKKERAAPNRFQRKIV